VANLGNFLLDRSPPLSVARTIRSTLETDIDSL